MRGGIKQADHKARCFLEASRHAVRSRSRSSSSTTIPKNCETKFVPFTALLSWTLVKQEVPSLQPPAFSFYFPPPEYRLYGLHYVLRPDYRQTLSRACLPHLLLKGQKIYNLFTVPALQYYSPSYFIIRMAI